MKPRQQYSQEAGQGQVFLLLCHQNVSPETLTDVSLHVSLVPQLNTSRGNGIALGPWIPLLELEMELASSGAPSCIVEGRRSQQSWESLNKKVGEWVLGKLHLFAGNRKPNLQET